MRPRTICSIYTLISVALISATVARAQAPTVITVPTLALNAGDSWQGAQLIGSARKGKLYVVTIDHPDRRQACRVQSFTREKLVCARALGGPRTYLPQQVLALIVPGDEGLRLPLWLGFNGGLGAAIWGTVVLAAACPACAAGTGIAALFFFGAAGAVAYADGQPKQLLYLAPGQRLSGKLGFVER